MSLNDPAWIPPVRDCQGALFTVQPDSVHSLGDLTINADVSRESMDTGSNSLVMKIVNIKAGDGNDMTRGFLADHKILAGKNFINGTRSWKTHPISVYYKQTRKNL